MKTILKKWGNSFGILFNKNDLQILEKEVGKLEIGQVIEFNIKKIVQEKSS